MSSAAQGSPSTSHVSSETHAACDDQGGWHTSALNPHTHVCDHCSRRPAVLPPGRTMESSRSAPMSRPPIGPRTAGPPYDVRPTYVCRATHLPPSARPAPALKEWFH